MLKKSNIYLYFLPDSNRTLSCVRDMLKKREAMKKEQPYMHKIIGDAEMNLNVQETKLFCFCHSEILILNYVK